MVKFPYIFLLPVKLPAEQDQENDLSEEETA